MMNDITAPLRQDEKAVLLLRNLYEQYGYKKYKMSKFENYELYLENKSFLASEIVSDKNLVAFYCESVIKSTVSVILEICNLDTPITVGEIFLELADAERFHCFAFGGEGEGITVFAPGYLAVIFKASLDFNLIFC